MKIRDYSPTRLTALLERLSIDELDKKLSFSSTKSTDSISPKQLSQSDENVPKSLRQQLTSYYSWSNLYEREAKEKSSELKRPPFQNTSEHQSSDIIQSGYNKYRSFTEEELAESRQRAIQRLTDKRKEIQIQSEKQLESDKLEENMPRIRWRGGLKKKRLQDIDDHLDRSILQDVIKNDPNLLIQVLNDYGSENKSELLWKELSDGLEVDSTNHMRSPFKRFAENMKRQYLLSQSDMLQNDKLPRIRGDVLLSQPNAKTFLKKISDSMNAVQIDEKRSNSAAILSPSSITSVIPKPLRLDNMSNQISSSDANDQESPDFHNNVGVVNEDDMYGQYANSSDHDLLNNGTFDSLFYKKSNRKRSSGLLSKFVDKVNIADSGHEIPYVAAEGGYYLIPGFYDPNSEAGLKLISDLSFERYFQRFAEAVFVAGPLAEDVITFAEQSSAQFLDGSNDGSKVLTLKLEPHILFKTALDEDIDANSLPKFCFPCWTDVKAAKMTTSPTDIKPNSTSVSLSQKLSSTQRQNKHFIHASKTFAFILSSHKKNSNTICLSVPRTFHFPSINITVETEYCIAIVSYFPYISYFAHILEQFESIGGFQFSEPLQVQEDGFPILPEFRQFDDLGSRLNRLLVPTYNGVVPEEELPSKSDSNSKENDVIQPYQRSTSSTDDVKICYLNHHVPVGFTLGHGTRLPSHQKLRIDLTFKRDIFQTYYGCNEMNPVVHPDIRYKNLYSPNEQQEQEKGLEQSFHFLLWSLPILLSYLSLDDILLTIGCMMTEMKTIVAASDPVIVSGCIYALLSLLEPLKWQGNVIVTLPDEYAEYLETPSPMIAGVDSLPQGFQTPDEGIIIIKPEERKVLLHVNDVVQSHTLQLPRANSLIPILRPHVETILKLTIRAREGLRFPPVFNTSGSMPNAVKPQNDSNDSSLKNAAVEASNIATGISQSNVSTSENLLNSAPLPIDVDVESDRGKALLTAIQGFATAMTAHIQAIVNTSVKLAWDSRKYERKKLAKRQLKPGNMQSPSGIGTRTGTPGSASNLFNSRRLDSSSISLVSELTDVSSDNIALTETDSTETANSLPSVRRDAPILPPRDIGDSALRFIKRLQDTQSYSVYCYSKSSKKREEQEVDDVWDAYKYREHQLSTVEENAVENSPDGHSQRSVLFESSPSAYETSANDGIVKSIRSSSQSIPKDEGYDEDSSTFREDPLILLFQILLSGTKPMSQAQLDRLSAFIDAEKSVDLLREKICWCNGRCNGLANTPFCTNICMLLWEMKVNDARKQMNIRGIIERQHHSDLVLNTKVKVDVKDHDGYVKQSKEVSLKPKLPVVKHKRETESQYQLRKAEIESTNVISLGDTGNTSSFHSLSPSYPNIHVDVALNDLDIIEHSPTTSLSPAGMTDMRLDVESPSLTVDTNVPVTEDLPSDEFGLPTVPLTPLLSSHPGTLERRFSDNMSLLSIDDVTTASNQDDITSVDLPNLPIQSVLSMRTPVPLPIELMTGVDVSVLGYKEPQPKDIKRTDRNSYSKIETSPVKAPTLSKQQSKYTLSFQSKKEKKRTSLNSVHSTGRNSLNTKQKKTPSQRLVTNQAIYAPRFGPNGAPARRLYARSDAPPVIRAIAFYYAKKQRQRLRQHTVFASKLVQSFLLTCCLQRRYKKIQSAIVTIQRYLRGYYLRRYELPRLKDKILQYKCGKILSRLVFKLWIRRHIKQIILYYKRRKEERLRDERIRLSEDSIHSNKVLSSTDIFSDHNINIANFTTSSSTNLMAMTYPPSVAVPNSSQPKKDKSRGILSSILHLSSNHPPTNNIAPSGGKPYQSPVNSNMQSATILPLTQQNVYLNMQSDRMAFSEPASPLLSPIAQPLSTISANGPISNTIGFRRDDINNIPKRQDASGSERSLSPALGRNMNPLQYLRSHSDDTKPNSRSTSPFPPSIPKGRESSSNQLLRNMGVGMSNSDRSNGSGDIKVSRQSSSQDVLWKQANRASVGNENISSANTDRNSSSVPIGMMKDNQNLHEYINHADIYQSIDFDNLNIINDDRFFTEEDDDTLVGPFKSLGPAAKDAITPQQKAILKDMWSLLVHGVEVMKLDRSRRQSNPRYLYCDPDMTKLFWRQTKLIEASNIINQGRLSDHSMENAQGANPYAVRSARNLPGIGLPQGNAYGSRTTTSSQYDEAQSDTTSVYGGMNGNQLSNNIPPIRKRAFFDNLKKKDADRELFFHDILQVCDDITVENRRSSVKDNKSSVISIIVADRTVDFEIEKKYWEKIYHALQVLVNYYRVILPGLQAPNNNNLATTTPLGTYTVAGRAYHHRSSSTPHHETKRRSTRGFQSKTPLVISEAVQINSVNHSNNRINQDRLISSTAIGDDWNNIEISEDEND